MAYVIESRMSAVNQIYCSNHYAIHITNTKTRYVYNTYINIVYHTYTYI